ncbi:integrin beta subunit [Holotrichia oblita]|uniref:Integrin beta subunit n=1 Tax=Holotrichia oblita TaxID=644536 RepID=A0ACB9TD67_HOLOL|nr:integrin beta subunit [Holotrichia oblita]
MRYYAFIVLCLVVCVVKAQESCENLEKCSECIRKLGCIWCSNPDDKVHCKSDVSILNLTTWCSEDKLVNPKSTSQLTEDSEINTSLVGDVVQIRPQRVKLSIRKGEQFTIPFEYSRASNYPIDLYYIMDLSYSMKLHKEKLAELGGKLIDVMQNITSDFRLGFGSFVDKPTMPFAAPREYKDCPQCERSYSFQNHLSLTSDHNNFIREVNNTPLSTNTDLPEGGFDALMQTIVCKDQIGWRDTATHLIVFSTDATYHFAGDGKLGGLYEPNDMQCHLETNGHLTLLDQDYPSVGQLEYIIKQNDMHLIFAIADNAKYENISDHFEDYRELSQEFSNSYFGKLDDNSSNVVNLIKDIYNQITDTIRITDNAPPTVQITYQNDRCDHPSYCTGIRINEKIKFNATIEALECPSISGPQEIRIKPAGVNEALTIDLEVICSCDCELPDSGDFIKHSEKCSKNGDEICGVCSCYDGYFGSTCECNAQTVSPNDTNHCMRDPTKSEICSGLGTCKCGTCICEKRPSPYLIYGKYCECDNFSCKREHGELCNGPDHGNCKCGRCECLSGWGGEDCACSTSKKTCTAPNGKEVCSGRGQCVCGECKCNEDDNYFGKYCEESPSEAGQRCSELFECIEVILSNSTEADGNATDLNCTDYSLRLVDKIDEANLKENEKICREIDASGCTVVFKYTYEDDERLDIQVQEERLCPKPLDICMIVAIIIVSILLGGIIMLIIWKVLTHIHDNKEFAKFIKNTENSKWSAQENPIYKQASTTVTNPLYGEKKDW